MPEKISKGKLVIRAAKKSELERFEINLRKDLV